MRLSEAVHEHSARLVPQGVAQEVLQHCQDGARVEEALLVDDLAARFAVAEVRGEPLGRAVVGQILPPMGDLLSKPIGRGGPRLEEALRDAIVLTLGVGYVSFMSAEPAGGSVVRLERRPSEIWAFWIPRIYDGFLGRSLPERDLQTLHEVGSAVLSRALEPLDLGRRSHGRRMGMLGLGYAEAGALLRAAQSSQTPDHMIATADPLVGGWRWPLERFPP